MGKIASQITSITIVYSTVYSGAYQRKHQSSASLAFVWGIHREPVNSPHKWSVTRKMFPFDDVIMRSATLYFTCARNDVFRHKINFCVDGERMVCFRCVWLCFICVSFQFTLSSWVLTLSLRCYRAQSELKMVSNQHIVKTKDPEHTLAPICWE